MKAAALTTFALIAFAFNSILCRMALGGEEIDAASFTVVRLFSGALTLAVIVASTRKTRNIFRNRHWLSAFFLFAYAVCFSFAYLGLTAGTGALILFAFVQITMISFGIFKGERPAPLEWTGFAIAFGGLIYLVFPGIAAPPISSAMLMAFAGIAWGFYTLRGKGSDDPLADTTGNFMRAVPMIVVFSLPFLSQINLSIHGVVLAALSGAIASGLGYTIWYSALKYHTATRAAILQLQVPLLTAIGGVLLLSETADLRLVIAGFLILGGIGLAVARKNISHPSEKSSEKLKAEN